MGQCLLCFVETEFLLSCSHWSYRNDPPALAAPPPSTWITSMCPHTQWVLILNVTGLGGWLSRWGLLSLGLVPPLEPTWWPKLTPINCPLISESTSWHAYAYTCTQKHAQVQSCACIHTCMHVHTHTCKRLNYMCSWWQIRQNPKLYLD